MSSETSEMPKRTYADPTRNYRRRWSAWKCLLLAAGGLIVGVGLLAPFIIKSPGKYGHERIRSLNNMRQIGISLYSFEYEFGSFPTDQTIKLVRERHPESTIPLGTSSSNDYFHQLFAAEIISEPRIFHGHGVSTHRSFEWLDGEPPLPPGTCGFAYIIRDADMTPDDTPILVYPLVRGKLVFDQKLCKLWGNKALVLHGDLGARSHPIDSSGRLIIDGRDLFDPDHPHWHGRSFRVAWPE